MWWPPWAGKQKRMGQKMMASQVEPQDSKYGLCSKPLNVLKGFSLKPPLFETSVIMSSVYKRVNRGTEKTTSLKTHSHGEPHWVDTQSCPVGQEQGLVSRSFRDRFHT